MTFEEYGFHFEQHLKALREAIDARDRDAALLAFKTVFEFMRKFGPDAMRGRKGPDPDVCQQLAEPLSKVLLEITRRFGKMQSWH